MTFTSLYCLGDAEERISYIRGACLKSLTLSLLLESGTKKPNSSETMGEGMESKHRSAPTHWQPCSITELSLNRLRMEVIWTSSDFCFTCSLCSDLCLINSLFILYTWTLALTGIYLAPPLGNLDKLTFSCTGWFLSNQCYLTAALCAITLQCPKAGLGHLFTYKHVARSTCTSVCFCIASR